MTLFAEIHPERVHANLATHAYGRSLVIEPELPSTNAVAMRALREGAPSGHTVVADCQSAGRGQHGRRWDSPPGVDLYLSVVDRPLIAARRAPLLSLAVGLAVARCAERALGPEHPVQIKWPNDLLCDGAKFAGVLVEATGRGDRLSGVVIGVGLNVNRVDFAPELRATSLRLVRGQSYERAGVLADLLLEIERQIHRLQRRDPAAILADLRPRLAQLGELVTRSGVSGRMLGLDPDGALMLQTPSGQVKHLR